MKYKIIDFDKYKHYKTGKHPPWIKLPVSIFKEKWWRALGDADRSMAIVLIVMASKTDGVIDVTEEFIESLCHDVYCKKIPSFEVFVHAGLLVPDTVDMASTEVPAVPLPPDPPKPAPEKEAIDYAAVYDAWNRICHSLPKVQSDTKARRASIKERWLQFKREFENSPLEVFEKLFTMVEASDFLTGRRQQQGSKWRCNFDWVIAPSNTAKILEGVYANTK